MLARQWLELPPTRDLITQQVVPDAGRAGQAREVGEDRAKEPQGRRPDPHCPVCSLRRSLALRHLFAEVAPRGIGEETARRRSWNGR
jgi:hypothetical protein